MADFDFDFGMDVQIGPEFEINLHNDDSEYCDCCKCTPIDKVKASVDNINVAKKKCENCNEEFYVDASDLVRYAEINEESLIESLNDIIGHNYDEGMNTENTILVVDESTLEYVPELEKHGVMCVRFVSEAEKMEMDVQQGPNDDKIIYSADPQDANPFKGVKQKYDNVVIASSDDEFFVDVEDVQKCADINCESVIDTLNHILSVNEDAGVNADNLHVVVSDNTDDDVIDTLRDYNVSIEYR